MLMPFHSHININNHVQYTHLHPKFQTFVASLDSTHDPLTFEGAVIDPAWCHAMNIELHALERNVAREITQLPHGKRAIGCK